MDLDNSTMYTCSGALQATRAHMKRTQDLIMKGIDPRDRKQPEYTETDAEANRQALQPQRTVQPRKGVSCPGDTTQRAVQATLTRYTGHFLVGTSVKLTSGHSKRTPRRDIAQGTYVPHDGLAEVPASLNTRRRKTVTVVHMSRVRTMLAPVVQSGSGTTHEGSGGNVGRATRVNHGGIQRGVTNGWGKGHHSVGAPPP
jgi:hypothetical protein